MQSLSENRRKERYLNLSRENNITLTPKSKENSDKNTKQQQQNSCALLPLRN